MAERIAAASYQFLQVLRLFLRTIARRVGRSGLDSYIAFPINLDAGHLKARLEHGLDRPSNVGLPERTNTAAHFYTQCAELPLLKAGVPQSSPYHQR
jgi:hypothetical protein